MPGTFKQGDVSDTYTITVTNLGTLPTTGTVSLVDSFAGRAHGNVLQRGRGGRPTWRLLTATRSDALAAGASYAPLVLTVNVAANAPPCVTNVVTVSGGGETNTTNDYRPVTRRSSLKFPISSSPRATPVVLHKGMLGTRTRSQ